ncbi:MAG: ABC transporter substrate-binding protein [Lachnospiraceae bacterium]|jgi:iron complex transport system substrate-binding protein|nr:ABC transporter substrate-binding protein [Lachnospiraceae bacterium]
MKKRILSLMMATAMISTLLVGCGNKTTETAETTVAETVAETVAAESTEAEASNATTDRSGNEIVIPEEVNKIISMAPSTTQVLVDLGLGDKIVACDTYSFASYGDSLTADIPQFDMMTPDQEQIVALGADVVFTSGMSSKDGDDAFASVREAGICVADIPSSASLADIQEDIRFIGKVVGKEAEADALVSQMQTVMDEIAEVAATIADDEKKTVLFELFTPSADSPTIYTCGSNTYIDEMISLIGAKNVAGEEKDQWPALTEEAAVGMNPDVILTADMYTDDVINVLLTMKGWENVSAIQNKAVYQIDNDTVNRPNHHVVSAMLEMAQDIYPELFDRIEDPFADGAEVEPAA